MLKNRTIRVLIVLNLIAVAVWIGRIEYDRGAVERQNERDLAKIAAHFESGGGLSDQDFRHLTEIGRRVRASSGQITDQELDDVLSSADKVHVDNAANRDKTNLWVLGMLAEVRTFTASQERRYVDFLRSNVADEGGHPLTTALSLKYLFRFDRAASIEAARRLAHSPHAVVASLARSVLKEAGTGKGQ